MWVSCIEIIDIECVLLFFSGKNLSPQNGGFRRAFLVVPDSYGEIFARLRGVRMCDCFFVKQSLEKDIKLVTLNGKMVHKKF